MKQSSGGLAIEMETRAFMSQIGSNSPSKKGGPAFTLIPDSSMPTPGEIKWSKDRLERLMQWPGYKPLREKSVMLPPHLRNNSPMTM
jgi:hypothetical protein